MGAVSEWRVGGEHAGASADGRVCCVATTPLEVVRTFPPFELLLAWSGGNGTRDDSAGTEFAGFASGPTGGLISANGRSPLRPCWNGESVVAGAAVATTLGSGRFVNEGVAWPEDSTSRADSSKGNGRGSWLACDGLRPRGDFSVAFPFLPGGERPALTQEEAEEKSGDFSGLHVRGTAGSLLRIRLWSLLFLAHGVQSASPIRG